MQYEFLPTGEPQLVNQPTSTITLTDTQGNPIQIQQASNQTATKYLGTHKCIGNHNKQLDVLLKKCNEFARIITCSHLTRKETQCFYWAIYRLSANYALPTTYFTAKELNKIQAKSHAAFLSKSGYNRNMPSVVVYGPPSLGGAGFFHLYDDQGYGQIKLFMKFWRSPYSTAGKLLRISMAWHQFSVGTSIPLLEDTRTKLPHLESKWLATLRSFLKDVSGKLIINDTLIAPLQRTHDGFIMDKALHSGKFKPAALRRLNYCRLYLNVLLMSDIASPCGNEIDPTMYTGVSDDMSSWSDHHSVNQQCPNEKAWKEWRKFLNLVTTTQASRLLTQPLGEWLVPANQLRRQWPFLYDSDSDTLFHQNFLGISAHRRLRHDFDKDSDVLDPLIPHSAVPATVQPRPSTWTLKRWIPQYTTPTQGPFGTFYASRHVLPPWEYMLLKHLTLEVPELELWTTLCTQSCHIASDGSAPHNKGSYAWIICDGNGMRLACCAGPVQGHRISSYRAESYGLLSALGFLVNIRDFYTFKNTHDKNLMVHMVRCDNEGIVTKINSMQCYRDVFPNATMSSEWDVIAKIRASILQLGTSSPQLEHVLGHQDKDTPYVQLPLSAQLNCDADKEAATFLSEHPDEDFKNAPVFPTSGCQLQLVTGTVTYDIKQSLQHARHAPPLQARLCLRHAWSDEEFHDVDWISHSRALKRHDKHRVTMVKYLHDWLPLGKRVHTYNKKYPASCPSCNAPVEDRTHFWACPSEERHTWKRGAYQSIKKYLQTNNTAPDLQTLMLDGLQMVLYHQATRNKFYYHLQYQCNKYPEHNAS